MERWNQELVDKYDDAMNQLDKVIREILTEKIGENIQLSFDDDVVCVKLEKVEDKSFTIKYKDKSFAYGYRGMEPYPFREGYEGAFIRMNKECYLNWRY